MLNKKLHKNLIVDLNNNVFITRFSKIKTPSSSQRKEQFVTELIFKEVVSSIVYFANEFKCDSIVIACDSPNVWRKTIKPDYKAGRDYDDVYYKETLAAADLTKEFFSECTNATVIEAASSEADDIIAVFCQESSGVENVILSSDKDFVQLIDESTTLYSPSQGIFRTTEDAEYDLFLKCIRGDKNDNINSAFPRVRETKLKEAWEDPYVMQNLLETHRKDGVKVKDAYEENKKLIDLSLQPPAIRQVILTEITKDRPNKFGELKIMKFFGQNNLKDHKNMLEYKERPLRKRFVLRAE